MCIRDSIGVTSISATYDRVATPYGQGRIPGVEVHAQLFETLERGRFLTDASNLSVLGFCLAAGILAGVIFAFLSGWPAYAAVSYTHLDVYKRQTFSLERNVVASSIILVLLSTDRPRAEDTLTACCPAPLPCCTRCSILRCCGIRNGS